MTRTSLKDFNCSIAQTMDIVGDKWAMLIIRDALYGFHRFSDFQKSLGVARNILADRLSQLVDTGILERRQTKPDVERYEYYLTEKGQSLLPVLIALLQWGDKWVFAAEGEPVRILDRKTKRPVQTVAVQARDGRILKAEDVMVEPGPNAPEDLREAIERSAETAG